MAGDMILVVDFGGYQARTMARMKLPVPGRLCAP